MHFDIKSENIIKILKILSTGFHKTYSQETETFSNILIKISKKNLLCISINNESEIIVHENLNTLDLNVTKYQDGEIVMPFKKLFDILKTNSKDSTCSISKKGNQIEIYSNNSKFLLTCTTKIFPELRNTSEVKFKIQFQYEKLKPLFNKTFFSTAENDTRQFLNGINIEKKDKTLYMTSSDGYRLSRIYTNIEDENITNFNIIVPKRTIFDINNIFDKLDIVHISFYEKFIKFNTEKIILISKLIDDIFPEYEKVITTKNFVTLIINKSQFKMAISKCNILYSERNKKTKISIKKNNIVISTANTEECVSTTIYINSQINNDIEILINTIYIIEVLNVIDSENIKISFSKTGNELIITEIENNYIHTIMAFKT